MFVPTTTSTNGNNKRLVLVGQPRWLSSEAYSLCILALSAVLVSTMAAFVKLASATGIPSTELVFLRALFQGAWVVVAMMHYRDVVHTNIPLIRMPFGGRRVRAVVVTRGAFGGVGLLLYYYTMSVLPLGDAMTLLSLSPVITVWAAALVLKEPVRLSHVAAGVGSVVGCVLIAQPSFLFRRQSSSSTYSYMGYITGLLGSCVSTAVFILIRLAGLEGVHTLQLLFSWVCFGTFYSLLLGVLRPALSLGGHPFLWPASATAVLYVLGACVFGSMGHFLMNYAARHAPAGLSSILRSSSILWSYGLEVIIFHQVPARWTVVGASLIVLSLATIALEKHLEHNSTVSPSLEEDMQLQKQRPTVALMRNSYMGALPAETRNCNY